MVALNASASFDSLTQLVLHHDRLLLLDHEPPRTYKGPELESLQLLISDLKSHLDDYATVSTGGGSDKCLHKQESPYSVDFASGLPLKMAPNAGVIFTTPV